MKLTNEHVEILRDARKIMERNQWHGYICIAIENVLRTRFEIEYLIDNDQASLLRRQLTRAITDSMHGVGTVFSYLRHTVPGLEEMPLNEYGDFSSLARQAWLDRMIETRTIA